MLLMAVPLLICHQVTSHLKMFIIISQVLRLLEKVIPKLLSLRMLPFPGERRQICASIVAKLQCSGVANSLVSSVVSDLEDLTTEMHTQTRQDVISVIPPNNPVRSAVEESLAHFESPFSMFNTETKRTNYFNDKWGVVEPVEIVLGMRYDMRRKLDVMIRSQ